MAVVYSVRNKLFTTSEAIIILANPQDDQCISSAPINVRGGEAYLFKPKCADEKGKLIDKLITFIASYTGIYSCTYLSLLLPSYQLSS